MSSSPRTQLTRGAIAALLTAILLWFAGPLAADGQKPAAKKQTPAKAAPAPRTPAMPRLRAERGDRESEERRERRLAPGQSSQEQFRQRGNAVDRATVEDEATPRRTPREQRMRRARAFDGDLRTLPQTRDPIVRERPEREGPSPSPVLVGTPPGVITETEPTAPAALPSAVPAPAPPPTTSFEGLDRVNWGAGIPPDTNGDVGPEYYIQTINTSIGIYRKTDGFRVAAFTFNTFMSQGQFGNLCDTNNFGDPVVLYDSFEDRWIITDFAFRLDSTGAVVNPPGAFQCFAASKTGDPVSGGWNFYSINVTGGLGDYPKFGIWPDGLYMSANVFDYAAGGAFQNPRVFAINKAQLYSGSPTVQVVSFDAPAADFTLLPSNARLQTGTPPAGTPNYFVSTWQFLNAVGVYRFHVDWDRVTLSTLTGPSLSIASTSWPNAGVPNAPSQKADGTAGNLLDVLQIRAMMQNQYTNINGAESLWDTHTVRRLNTTGFAAPRWYQVDVTGGTLAATLPQATTWDPDGANVIFRFMPSLAVDRAGNMALGYSTSNSTSKPAMKYAGRLADDPINTFSQTEQLLFQGTGTQVGNCGGSSCTRWGDYSAMTLDPDGCSFWYTNEYHQADGLSYRTRIGSFAFAACTPVTSGVLQGTARTGGAPLAGATVALGTRTTTTDASGVYVFSNLPPGTYPSVTASAPGYAPQSFAAIVVSGGATTTQDFSLVPGSSGGCLIDTTLEDFQAGLSTSCDLTSSPGDITLLNGPVVNQQNLSVTNSGFGFNATNWTGQTFTPSLDGQLTRVDLDLFCSGCTGTTPNLLVSIRATDPVTLAPTGADLAVATIPGFSSGSGGFFAANFATPFAVTAGTRYAVMARPVANPSAGIYAYVVSSGSPYANGQRFTSPNSGATFVLQTTDLGFKAFMKIGFPPSGTFTSATKDANPATGATATWATIGWTADVPAGTTLRFQAAASNVEGGPFTFVGPDGTAATFFTNGGSLSQFDGNRYMKYKALLDTTSLAATPIIHDVSLCFTNVQSATSMAVDPASGDFGGSTTVSATLTAGGTGLVGKQVAFSLNGNPVGTAVTDGVGFASVTGVSLAGIDAGTYPGAVVASYAGELGYTPSTGSNTLTVAQLPQAIDFAALPDKLATDPPFQVTATGGASGNPVTFSTTSTACSVSGNTVTINAAGSCAITANQAANTNYTAAPPVTRTFNIAFASQTITFGALANKTYGDPDFTVSATASSGLTVSFAAAGACSVSGTTVHILAVGSCDITASQGGDARYSPAAPVTQSFSIGRATGVFSGLVNPPIVLSSLFVTLHGRLGPAGLTTGGIVTITLGGMTRTATVAADGSFSTQFLTLLLPPSPGLPVTYSYPGSATVTPASATSVLPILYEQTGSCVGDPGHVVLPPLSPTSTVTVKQNSTVPVKFRVCNVFHLPVGWIPVVSHFYFMGNTAGATTPVSEVTDHPFTFELDDLLWKYELKTKSLVSGRTYYYRILLNDGTFMNFSFKVK
jgi:hypothetical protein